MSEDVHIEPSGRGIRCPPPRKVHYPESNGLPIAETRFQYDSLTYATGALDIYFQDRPDVAVEGFRLLYYVEGDPRSRVAPDVFVVIGAPKRRRRTYQLWEEPKGPDFVLEVTSWSTRRRDQGFKRDLYARLGVGEYWLFDPTGDWLDPRLQGNRLADGTRTCRSRRFGIEGGERVLRSAVLGLDVYVDGEEIRFRNPATGRKLLTLEETERALGKSGRKLEETDRKLEETDRKLEETNRKLEETDRKLEEFNRALKKSNRDLKKSRRALKEARAHNAELEARLRDATSSVPTRQP